MDKLDAMRLFVRICERLSFTEAAQDSGVPRSTVTQVIKQLESQLGVRLLHRTTRVVRPTLDGEVYYRRCINILDDIEDAEGAFRGMLPKGVLRVEVQGTLARHFLMPALADFFTQFPDIKLVMSESDRWVDLVHEGVDCALRWGTLPDSELMAKRLGMAQRFTCASPGYLGQAGHPVTLDALGGHRMVGIRPLTTNIVTPLEFLVNGDIRSITLPVTLSVTGPESYLLGTQLGHGLAQLPYFHIKEDLLSGKLIRVLPHIPIPSVPVSVLYPRNRQLSLRVRVFIDWLVQRFSTGLGSSDSTEHSQ